MHRDIRPGRCIRRRRKIVGIGFAGHLEHRELLRCWHFRARSKPLRIGPALQYSLGVGVPLVGQILDIMEVVKDEECFLERFGSNRSDLGIAEHVAQRFDVVAAKHRSQQFGRLGTRNEFACLAAGCHFGQKFGFHLGRIINTRRYAVGDEFN